MQSVEFTAIIRGAVAESGGAESGEMLFLRKLLEDRRGGADDVGMVGKPVAAIADIDSSQLPGPSYTSPNTARRSVTQIGYCFYSV